MEIYGVNFLRNIDSSRFQHLIRELPLERQEKLKKCYHYEDAERGLLADLLIRYIIEKQGIAKDQEIHFEKDDYGKPRLLNITNFEFNLSHSGEWVVCAIDHTPIGIDVEMIKPIDLHIANQFFTSKERDYIFSFKHSRVSRFFEIWTLKESYIKAVGMGLSIPLDSFSVVPNTGNQTITLETNSDSPNLQFKQYSLDPNYKLAICASNDHFPLKITQIELEELVQRDRSLVPALF